MDSVTDTDGEPLMQVPKTSNPKVIALVSVSSRGGDGQFEAVADGYAI